MPQFRKIICLVGRASHASGKINGVAMEATNESLLLNIALVLAISTAQRICAIRSYTDKNSNHSFAKLSAWWVRASHADGRFRFFRSKTDKN